MVNQQGVPISETSVLPCLCEKQNIAELARLTVQRPDIYKLIVDRLAGGERRGFYGKNTGTAHLRMKIVSPAAQSFWNSVQ
jgi:hypothetical protein